MKKAMKAFFCGCFAMILLLAATGCQSSSNSGSSLKADQIVFDVECNISVLVSEREIASGTFKNSGTETVFTMVSPNEAKGLVYKDVNGAMEVSLNGLTLDGYQSLLPKYSWFTQLLEIIRYAKEQPDGLQAQGNGKYSGTTLNGTSFVITARNKGTIEKITVEQFELVFS